MRTRMHISRISWYLARGCITVVQRYIYISISIALWAMALQPPSVFRQLEHILVTLRPYIVLFSLSSIHRRRNQITPAVLRRLAVYLNTPTIIL